jgi:hypothetical protein
LVGGVSGTVRGDNVLTWKEGVCIRVDWANDKPWLVVEPRTIFGGLSHDNRARAADFARERTIKRYNGLLNNLIAFSSDCLAKDGGELRALDIGDGVDAVFQLGRDTAYSRRAQA